MDNYPWQMLDDSDRLVEDALRTSPLAPAPPLLYAAVMRRVRQSAAYSQPVFRVAWLDLALSLFAAGMFGLGWLAWLWLPPERLSYLRLQALWAWQKAWYLDSSWLALGLGWLGLGAAAALAAVVLVVWRSAASRLPMR